MYGYVFRDDASAVAAAETAAAVRGPLQPRFWASRIPGTLTDEVLEGAQVG